LEQGNHVMIAQFLFSDDFKLKYTFTIILLDIYSL
jgi:hypothetical protein